MAHSTTSHCQPGTRELAHGDESESENTGTLAASAVGIRTHGRGSAGSEGTISGTSSNCAPPPSATVA